jgi:hypothetical protein
MALEFLLMSPGFNSFLCSWTSKALSVCVSGGGGHKMHIFTANIPIFQARYRGYVLITNEFYEFC